MKIELKNIILNNAMDIFGRASLGVIVGTIGGLLVLNAFFPGYLVSMLDSIRLVSSSYVNPMIDFQAMREFMRGFIEESYYDTETEKLGYTDYTNKTVEIMHMLTERCDFKILNMTDWVQYMIYDDGCIVKETASILQNEYYIYDYDHDGELVCRDKSISFCYIMRELGIPCYFIRTKEHVLNLVELNSHIYLLIDITAGGIVNMVSLGDFIYGRLA